jgi:hypothetical protein
MANPTPAEKQAAKDAQRRLDQIAEAIGVAAAGTAVVAALRQTSQSALVVGILAIGTFFYVMAKNLAAGQGRLAADPPRDDYRSATYPFRRKFDLSVFGTGPVVTPGVQAAAAMASASAYLSAMVRAFERAQGADLRGDRQARAQRLSETENYARRAGRALADVSASTLRLAEAVEALIEEEGLPEWPRRRISARFDQVLPDSEMARLYRSGVRIDEIRRTVRGTLSPELAAQLVTDLREAASENRTLATELIEARYLDMEFEESSEDLSDEGSNHE